MNSSKIGNSKVGVMFSLASQKPEPPQDMILPKRRGFFSLTVQSPFAGGSSTGALTALTGSFGAANGRGDGGSGRPTTPPEEQCIPAVTKGCLMEVRGAHYPLT